MGAVPAVVMYSSQYCPYCVNARRVFERKGVKFTDIAVDRNPVQRAEMEQRSGRYTVPQIWIGEQHIGGFDDLWRLEQRGELDALLSAKGKL